MANSQRVSIPEGTSKVLKFSHTVTADDADLTVRADVTGEATAAAELPVEVEAGPQDYISMTCTYEPATNTIRFDFRINEPMDDYFWGLIEEDSLMTPEWEILDDRREDITASEEIYISGPNLPEGINENPGVGFSFVLGDASVDRDYFLRVPILEDVPPESSEVAITFDSLNGIDGCFRMFIFRFSSGSFKLVEVLHEF